MTFPQIGGRLSAHAALLASAVLLGLVCVHAWNVLNASAPVAPNSANQPLALPAVADPASLHLFGSSETAAAPTNLTPAPPNLTLTGVIAASGTRPAVALLLVDGKQQAVRRGETVTAGWVLQEVQQDRVVLAQGGTRSELLMPSGKGGGTIAPVTPVGGPAGPHGGGPPGQSAQFRLDVQSLGPNHMAFSKAELSHGLQDPHLAAALGRAVPAGSGGLQLDEVPAGSLPDRIGLKGGDVLHSANGQALNSLTDLPRLYQEFGSSGDVRLEITRGGQPTILQYTMRP